MSKLAVVSASLAASLAIACGGSPKPQDTPKSTASGAPAAKGSQELYERLGGQRAIVAVVDAFVGRVAADSRINLRFSNTDIPQFKSLLVEFVCMATGGPCHYTGRDMETSHGGMELVDDERT